MSETYRYNIKAFHFNTMLVTYFQRSAKSSIIMISNLNWLFWASISLNFQSNISPTLILWEITTHVGSYYIFLMLSLSLFELTHLERNLKRYTHNKYKFEKLRLLTLIFHIKNCVITVWCKRYSLKGFKLPQYIY